MKWSPYNSKDVNMLNQSEQCRYIGTSGQLDKYELDALLIGVGALQCEIRFCLVVY